VTYSRLVERVAACGPGGQLRAQVELGFGADEPFREAGRLGEEEPVLARHHEGRVHGGEDVPGGHDVQDRGHGALAVCGVV
jgi:hypothetical protein